MGLANQETLASRSAKFKCFILAAVMVIPVINILIAFGIAINILKRSDSRLADLGILGICLIGYIVIPTILGYLIGPHYFIGRLLEISETFFMTCAAISLVFWNYFFVIKIEESIGFIDGF